MYTPLFKIQYKSEDITTICDWITFNDVRGKNSKEKYTETQLLCWLRIENILCIYEDQLTKKLFFMFGDDEKIKKMHTIEIIIKDYSCKCQVGLIE